MLISFASGTQRKLVFQCNKHVYQSLCFNLVSGSISCEHSLVIHNTDLTNHCIFHTLPAQLYCAHRTASAVARNAVRVSVVIRDLGLPIAFAPLHFPNFEASPKYLTGTS